MSIDDFRDRVRDLVVEMAATGQTGHGLPGGVRRRGRHRRVHRGVRDAGLRRPVGAREGRRAVRPVRRRDPPARHPAAPRRLPRRPGHRPADGLLRDDRDRPRLQRPGARHRRDVRRRDRGVRDHHARRRRHARTTSATRPGTRELAVVFAQLEVGGEGPRACTRSSCRSARTASRSAGVRIEDCGRKMGLNGVDNGRIWFDGRAGAARAPCSTASPTSPPDGAYESPIDNPNRRFFTMLGTLVQGRVCVGGAGINAAKVALDDRDQVRRTVAGSSRRPRTTAEELLLDYGMHQRRLFPLIARTYALHFAQEVVSRAAARGVLGHRATTSTPGASSSPGPPAPRRSAPGTPPGPSRSAARRAAARATWR